MLYSFFKEIYLYREYLRQSILRDLRNRYRRSLLGYFWSMLHPLGIMLILTLVFSNIMRMEGKDYAVFLLSGMIVWNCFNHTIQSSLGILRANQQLFNQINIPKYIFIISVIGSSTVNLILSIVPLVIISVFFQGKINSTILLFPIALIPLLMITTGISLFVSTLGVFFHDTNHLTEIGMQALYFLTPVLYKREMLPVALQKFLPLNPLVYVVEIFRDIFYYGTLPNLAIYFASFLFGLCLLFFGIYVFTKSQDKFLYFL